MPWFVETISFSILREFRASNVSVNCFKRSNKFGKSSTPTNLLMPLRMMRLRYCFMTRGSLGGFRQSNPCSEKMDIRTPTTDLVARYVFYRFAVDVFFKSAFDG